MSWTCTCGSVAGGSDVLAIALPAHKHTRPLRHEAGHVTPNVMILGDTK